MTALQVRLKLSPPSSLYRLPRIFLINHPFRFIFISLGVAVRLKVLTSVFACVPPLPLGVYLCVGSAALRAVPHKASNWAEHAERKLI